MGVGTPRSGEEMGEGGDDFYVAQTGKCADLLYMGGRFSDGKAGLA